MGSTVDDFAADAAAAVAFLAAQPKIDQNAVGILGHSEGGLTGPKVAATTPRWTSWSSWRRRASRSGSC